MAQFVASRFERTTVVLDGNEYLRCQFYECRVVVTRGNFALKGCTFDGCEFEFGGEAANIRDLVVGLQSQGRSQSDLPATDTRPPQSPTQSDG